MHTDLPSMLSCLCLPRLRQGRALDGLRALRKQPVNTKLLSETQVRLMLSKHPLGVIGWQKQAAAGCCRRRRRRCAALLLGVAWEKCASAWRAALRHLPFIPPSHAPTSSARSVPQLYVTAGGAARQVAQQAPQQAGGGGGSRGGGSVEGSCAQGG